ncbi:hypothetical protein [Streptomyces sp. NPDC087294]|uniref:hypothetical protein n=1 Tax=Streptomyces sp. NPDC087294 TaxID=3365777 RepID=UPI0038179371
MKRRTSPIAVALATATALALTACGGKTQQDRAASASPNSAGSSPTSPSASTGADSIDRPKMTFPSDFRMVFDRIEPSDATKAAALGDAENFIRGINYGIAQQNAESAAYKFYSAPGSKAQAYAKDQIQQAVDGSWTITGTQRYTRAKVTLADGRTRASVSFCDDDSKYYGRDIKTRKVLTTQPSDTDYYFFEIVMTASKDVKGLWLAEDLEVQRKATQCRA